MPRKLTLITALFVICLTPILFSIFTYPFLSPVKIFSGTLSDQETLIFFSLRLPRFILAFLVGAALSLAGASFQSLLKNPLADPYILGVSGGSALGYIFALILGAPFFLMPIAGFGAALLSLILIYWLAKTKGSLMTLNLLLTGIIFNSFSFALILIMNSVVPFNQSQQILYLLMGSIPPVSWMQVLLIGSLILISSFILFLRANHLNLLSLGDEEAFHLGVNTVREKKIIFVLTSLLVGASVSVCGLIGFVGLFVPHLMRLIFGAEHKTLLPACLFFGGFFLCVADYLASHLFFWESLQTHLPVGAITALIGAPLFVFLLKRQAKT